MLEKEAKAGVQKEIGSGTPAEQGNIEADHRQGPGRKHTDQPAQKRTTESPVTEANPEA